MEEQKDQKDKKDNKDEKISSPQKRPDAYQQISQRMPLQAKITKRHLPQENLVLRSIDSDAFDVHAKHD